MVLISLMQSYCQLKFLAIPKSVYLHIQMWIYTFGYGAIEG